VINLVFKLFLIKDLEIRQIKLIYVNCSGLTDEQIETILNDDSNFVDYYEIPFDADGLLMK
jgi:hypothetical protein